MNAWLTELAAWLRTFSLHETMSLVGWIVPAVQTIHILAIGIVFSSSLVMALRALHVSGVDWTPARWGKRLNIWVGVALIILLVSGIVMIIGEPERSLLNPIFQTKMVLVVAASLLTLLLARRLKVMGPSHGEVDMVDRGLAVVLVLFWMAIISAGRWIAYYAG